MLEQLTVVIPTYQNYDLLYQCLQTLTHYAPGDYKILVVDNDDTEEGQQRVDRVAGKIDHDVEVHHTGQNTRVMGAFNAALSRCETNFMALYHDDNIMEPGNSEFWDGMLVIASYPSVGMVGPAVTNCTGLQHMERWDLPDIISVPYLNGACLVFRTEAMRNIGGLSEDISPCDDVELAIRTKALGYELIADRRRCVYHKRHTTYKRTRRPEKEAYLLELMFNKIVQRHGVRATCETFMSIPDWEFALMTCPAWGDLVGRMSARYPAWEVDLEYA